MKALMEQLKYEFERFDVKKEDLESVFIGGGTPSCVEAPLYEDVFTFVKPFLLKDAEITTEANPNSANLSWLKDMKNFGINRISFGVQSFDDEKLKYLGRNHSSKIAIKAVENADKIGIKNISLDLIHGVNKDSKKLLKNDLDIAFSLPINHISTYHLSIEKGTKFYKDKERSKDDVSMQRWFYSKIVDRGFEQYEISNFGTYRCRHNIGYWEHKDYIGVGAGAVGFLKNQRLYPHKSVERYIDEPLWADTERLSEDEVKMERVFLGLRSIAGVDKRLFNKMESQRVRTLIDEGKIYEMGDKIYNKDYLLSDEIALYLLS